MKHIYNFSPGPAKLDSSVISKSQDAVTNYQNTGLSILEIGHRSKDFETLINALQENMVNIFNIPSNYFTLLLQGGATYQNTFIANNFDKENKLLGCLVTGTWGRYSVEDFSKIRDTKIIELSDNEIENYVQTPWDLEGVDYLHLTSNETINGVQLREFNKIQHDSLLIDMSSDIGSYSFEWDNIAYVYAGAQKNMGIPGVSICIGNEKYLNSDDNSRYLDLGQLVEKNSLLNTPPTFSIYVLKLVTDWMIEMGGIKYFEEKSIRQSSRLYEQLQTYEEFLILPVNDYSKSRSNIIFKFLNEDLEKKFLIEAIEKGILGLNGHRSEGGIRISLYNSVTDEMVDYLSEFMDKFFAGNGK
ncbi:3-phosphoserine/phosphohydroxythreonine transaminase [Acidimicrobiaceae bacterium]|nr:3-phosphoserine/phosphohydroxythreonine transaminase [Acidimicrobiaceae bacterium]